MNCKYNIGFFLWELAYHEKKLKRWRMEPIMLLDLLKKELEEEGHEKLRTRAF